MQSFVRRWVAVAAAGTATAVLATTAASAGPRASFLRETGCRDIVGGDARYERDRVAPLPVSDQDYPALLERDAGRVSAVMGLATPSCSGVDYVLRVFDTEGAVIGTHVVSATADEDQIAFAVRLEQHDQDCLAVQMSTRVGSTTVDLAPDVLEDFSGVCDRQSGTTLYR